VNQYLAIIRGAPASGKTTIAKSMRDFSQKTVWLKVDNFKEFFSEENSLEEQKFVDECALSTLKYLLDQGFSVVMEKIFYDSSTIQFAITAAIDRKIPAKVFQIRCPLSVLQTRDRNRLGIQEGCRKPLGDETISRIYKKLEGTFFPGALELDTNELSVEECVVKIKSSLCLSL